MNRTATTLASPFDALYQIATKEEPAATRHVAIEHKGHRGRGNGMAGFCTALRAQLATMNVGDKIFVARPAWCTSERFYPLANAQRGLEHPTWRFKQAIAAGGCEITRIK